MNIGAVTIHPVVEQVGKEKLTEFLLEWSKVKKLNDTFSRFWWSVHKIRENTKKKKKVQEARLDVLEKRWNEEFTLMMRHCTKNKGKAKDRSLIKKMNHVSSDI